MSKAGRPVQASQRAHKHGWAEGDLFSDPLFLHILEPKTTPMSFPPASLLLLGRRKTYPLILLCSIVLGNKNLRPSKGQLELLVLGILLLINNQITVYLPG